MSWGLNEETYGSVAWGYDWGPNYLYIKRPPATHKFYGSASLTISRGPATHEFVTGAVFTITGSRAVLSLTTEAVSSGEFHIKYPNSSIRLFTGIPSSGSFNILWPKIVHRYTGSSTTSGTFGIKVHPHFHRFFSSAGYQTLVINTDTLSLPIEYSNFNFNSIIEFEGSVYMAGSDGIYKLTGTTDNGSQISAYFQIHDTDFSSTVLKSVEYITVGIDGGPISIQTAHDDSYNTAAATVVSTDMITKRVKHPKGLKQRYWGVKVSNVDGANFTIDGLELIVKELKRRINQP